MSKLYLLVRSDSPTAEIYLFLDKKQIASHSWEAHRELSVTLLSKIKELLNQQQKDWPDIDGIGVFAGPGSFTGLRISHAMANALAYASDIPAANAGGDRWQQGCIESLNKGGQKITTPDYGREARITQQKK